MALRFVEVRLPSGSKDEADAILEGHEVIDRWRLDGPGEEVHQYLLESQAVEPLADALRSRFGDVRVIVMPVEATMPRPAEPEVEAQPVEAPKSKDRVSREELYEDIRVGTALTPAFLAFAALSAVVASVGLVRDDTVAVIGAMVIAPLLGPNVGMALATTLADFDLLRKSLKAGLAGLALSFAIAYILGLFLTVDPAIPEIAARTQPDLGHLVLALASGIAGGLAFTTGVPSGLVGVMVAVALLPPLATAGLLLASGHATAALGAFVLLGTNLVAVNLAGIATFLGQGIRPLWHSEKVSARRAARNAIWIWGLLLIVFAAALGYIQLNV